MPIIRIETNVEQGKISQSLPADLTNVVSKTMDKEAKVISTYFIFMVDGSSFYRF